MESVAEKVAVLPSSSRMVVIKTCDGSTPMYVATELRYKRPSATVKELTSRYWLESSGARLVVKSTNPRGAGDSDGVGDAEA